jgi:hypothetical protein
VGLVGEVRASNPAINVPSMLACRPQHFLYFFIAACPITVTSSRCPRAFARRTQKPFSALWNVMRSTRPASTSWVDGSDCGFIRIVESPVLGGRLGAGKVKHDVRRHHYCMAARRSQEARGFVLQRRGHRTAP